MNSEGKQSVEKRFSFLSLYVRSPSHSRDRPKLLKVRRSNKQPPNRSETGWTWRREELFLKIIEFVVPYDGKIFFDVQRV